MKGCDVGRTDSRFERAWRHHARERVRIDPMNITTYGRRVDEFQQRHRFLAFPVAVIKKFGDDQGGNLSALIAYYGFLSLFPLLLVLFTRSIQGMPTAV